MTQEDHIGVWTDDDAPRVRHHRSHVRGNHARAPMRVSRTLAFVLILAGAGCSGGSTSEPPDRTPAALAIAAGDDQAGVVAMSTTIRPTVRVTDASDDGVGGVTVTFSITEGGGWMTEAAVATGADGLAATTWYLGPQPGSTQSLRAAAAGYSVTFSADAAPLVPGTTYRGAAQYVEFTPGDLPLIVSAPHGGTLRPLSIPTRSGANATTVRDAETDELALIMDDAFETLTGGTPHIVVMHLHREKLDANREIGEAAEGNAAAVRAWREYHGFLDAARQHVVAEHWRGLYIDLHGHGHAIPRLELGYLLTAAQLEGTDASLNSTTIVQRSSIRTLAEEGVATHADLIRGPQSLGTLLEAEGYPSVPSSAQPHPGGEPYFTGGYSTQRHGSRDGGPIDGIQIEANRVGVRDTEEHRQAFAAALATAVEAWFETHYGGALVVAAGVR